MPIRCAWTTLDDGHVQRRQPRVKGVKMKNPFSLFSRLHKWIHRELYEASDDPQAPERFRTKARKVLHNQTLIQILMVITWIAPFPFIPLFLWLIQIPYFAIGYIIWCFTTGTIWIALTKHEKNREKKSGSDLATEISIRV
jgi:hypothetical protein